MSRNIWKHNLWCDCLIKVSWYKDINFISLSAIKFTPFSKNLWLLEIVYSYCELHSDYNDKDNSYGDNGDINNNMYGDNNDYGEMIMMIMMMRVMIVKIIIMIVMMMMMMMMTTTMNRISISIPNISVLGADIIFPVSYKIGLGIMQSFPIIARRLCGNVIDCHWLIGSYMWSYWKKWTRNIMLQVQDNVVQGHRSISSGNRSHSLWIVPSRIQRSAW